MTKLQADLREGRDFLFEALVEDSILLLPKNAVPGMCGNFFFVQDAIGGRELKLDEGYVCFGADFKVNKAAFEYTILPYAIDIDGTVHVMTK